jgi:hypothetical protein
MNTLLQPFVFLQMFPIALAEDNVLPGELLHVSAL